MLTYLSVISVIAFAQDFPARSTTLVTDYTNTLDAASIQQLESKLVAYNDSTSTQIAIVLLKSTGGYDIAEYGAALGRKWGIGEKGKNNGILILAAIADHKVTIQTGYGAEGAVPDLITQKIIREDITPHFRSNDFYGGLDLATTDLIKYMRGEYKADAQTPQTGNDWGGIFAILIIVAVVLLIVFRNRGGGGQIIGSRGGASPFWWFLGGTMLGGGWGGNDNTNNGGDNNSGGDFGGFGGGDFGGGGSSGSW